MSAKLELQGPYARPIERAAERAYLQRERTTLIALTAGCKTFRRMGDPPEVIRVVSGPVFVRHGRARISVRGFDGGVEDDGRRCKDCPLGDLIAVRESVRLPGPSLEDLRERVAAALPALRSAVEVTDGEQGVAEARAQFPGGELRVTETAAGCTIFLAYAQSMSMSNGTVNVVFEVDAPNLGDGLQQLVDEIAGLPIGVPVVRREAFVAGVLVALVDVDDPELVESIAEGHAIGPSEALRVAAKTDGLDPARALLATANECHPQVLSLDPDDQAFEAVGAPLAPSAPWHVDVLGEIGPYFVGDEMAVAFLVEADAPEARTAFAALLAQELQDGRDGWNVTVIRDVRLLGATKDLRSIGIAIFDVDIADDQLAVVARFVEQAAASGELEGVVVLSGYNDERARMVWLTASAGWWPQTPIVSRGASLETRLHPDFVEEDNDRTP